MPLDLFFSKICRHLKFCSLVQLPNLLIDKSDNGCQAARHCIQRQRLWYVSISFLQRSTNKLAIRRRPTWQRKLPCI